MHLYIIYINALKLYILYFPIYKRNVGKLAYKLKKKTYQSVEVSFILQSEGFFQ